MYIILSHYWFQGFQTAGDRESPVPPAPEGPFRTPVLSPQRRSLPSGYVLYSLCHDDNDARAVQNFTSTSLDHDEDEFDILPWSDHVDISKL